MSRWEQSWKQGGKEGEATRQVAEGEYSDFPAAETFLSIFTIYTAHEKYESENNLEHSKQHSALVCGAHFPLSLFSKVNEALMKLISFLFTAGIAGVQ